MYRAAADAPARRIGNGSFLYRDVEELGAVYESLIDRQPVIEIDGRGQPVFALIAGSGRKATGSFYTLRELVAELVAPSPPVFSTPVENGMDNRCSAGMWGGVMGLATA